jgi:hypothetical protein
MSRAPSPARPKAARRSAPDASRRGPHIGPLRITPARVTLTLALAGGVAFLAWSVVVRDQLQVPLMATGLLICGLVLLVSGLLGLRAVLAAGREGRDGAAVLTALVAGLATALSMMLLAGAVIMSMIWGGTKAS